MTKRMLIDALHPEEVRVAIADNAQIFEFDFASSAKKQLKGNVYLAKITRVEPSLQAAFVEYGGGKQGFLPFSEIHPDYYQIPVSDRKKLMEDLEREHARLEAESDEDSTIDEPESKHENSDSFPSTEINDLAEATLTASDMPQAELPKAEEDLPPEETPISIPLEFSIPQSPMGSVEEAQENAEYLPPMTEKSSAETTSGSMEEGQEEAQVSAMQGDAVEGEEDSNTAESSKKDDEVETIASEEEELSGRNKRVPFFKRYRIQEVIKRGQIVLVQVIKEERGNKGVSLTTYLSLAGRYSVLMPNSPRDGGVSRKISDNETRKRLKAVMSELRLARGMSVIIRTAGIDRTRLEIKRDFDYLVKLWNQIRENTLAATAPALIYEESDIIKRAIRDQYTNDIQEVLVEGEEAYNSAREFMKMLLPSHTPRVKHYEESMPLFYAYGIEEQLLSMHDPVVKLRSGGYIVLNPTEALISIDVNSGRSTGERNIEETASKTNLEAAAEIARQLRLRDLAGLIVIDFIDMMESRNRRNVERALKDALKADRAKIQLGRISPFGLLEMSRQRLRPSIAEASTVSCPHCSGRGVVRSDDSMVIQIIRSLEKEAANGNWQSLKLNAPEQMVLQLLNHKRSALTAIEERYAVKITVAVDRDIGVSNFVIERIRPNGQVARDEGRERGNNRVRNNRGLYTPRNMPADNDLYSEDTGLEGSAGEEGEEQRNSRSERPDRSRRRRRGKRGGARENNDTSLSPEERAAIAEGIDSETQEDLSAELLAEDAPAEEVPSRTRGSRGRGRGRRRWRENEDGGEEQALAAESTEPVTAEPEAPTRAATKRPRGRPAKEASVPAATEEIPTSYSTGASELEFPGKVVPIQASEPPPPTHRPEGAPARKGWWQRMIELD